MAEKESFGIEMQGEMIVSEEPEGGLGREYPIGSQAEPQVMIDHAQFMTEEFYMRRYLESHLKEPIERFMKLWSPNADPGSRWREFVLCALTVAEQEGEAPDLAAEMVEYGQAELDSDEE